MDHHVKSKRKVVRRWFYLIFFIYIKLYNVCLHFILNKKHYKLFFIAQAKHYLFFYQPPLASLHSSSSSSRGQLFTPKTWNQVTVQRIRWIQTAHVWRTAPIIRHGPRVWRFGSAPVRMEIWISLWATERSGVGTLVRAAMCGRPAGQQNPDKLDYWIDSRRLQLCYFLDAS